MFMLIFHTFWAGLIEDELFRQKEISKLQEQQMKGNYGSAKLLELAEAPASHNLDSLSSHGFPPKNLSNCRSNASDMQDASFTLSFQQKLSINEKHSFLSDQNQ